MLRGPSGSPKRAAAVGELRIAALCDRVVAAALYQVLSAAIDLVLLPTCYGFRPGRSVLQMLAAIERTIVDQDRYVVATDDIADAFGSVVIDDALCGLSACLSQTRGYCG